MTNTKWSSEEDDALYRCVKVGITDPNLIAQALPTRTPIAIKNQLGSLRRANPDKWQKFYQPKINMEVIEAWENEA